MDREIFFKGLQGRHVVFCGIGRSHMPLMEMFAAQGARVTARDRRGLAELGENGQKLQALGVELVLGEGYLEGLAGDIIFRTPGMRFHLPQLEEARRRGGIVTSEMELFFKLCPCKTYAVTGSDGKTTTTSILAEFLRAQGRTVHLGGNIGKPLLPEIAGISPQDVAVVELSSFQLISMRQSPDVAVVTNLSPNHLDVHKDMEEYVQAKKNIFLHQDGFGRTVLNAGNAITAGFASEVRGDCWLFSRAEAPGRGVYCNGESIFVNGQKLLDVSEIKLPGWHNVENYMAAIAAAWGEVEPEHMRRVAREFNGVEHRMEFVRELDGVKYYNDSIASSPSRTISGTLSFYKEKIVLICGGYDKHIPYEPLGPAICQKVKTLILLGDTGPKIEAAVRASAAYQAGRPEILHAGNMGEAVALAQAAAASGDVVSLSPASASFDLYPGFEARGRHFKELVNGL
ncbi:UDP-N-acetylmuramoyl-L-alanine--D-glutamate ligase [Acutalibacter caecimuris]|uniref:UDP-N-acetylmuramoyl-L-alanine--D-glutamate ligase n=1 Tax=Acutalibacter caecimuris TaxID=3093657 RepID=UPI002AC8BB89|nr:UDP-N-acetylmuramoyl-L-alanine--D-glutamate ligase [Acutalibacter sp. M00118]